MQMLESMGLVLPNCGNAPTPRYVSINWKEGHNHIDWQIAPN